MLAKKFYAMFAAACLLLTLSATAAADEIRVAVASNFAVAIKAIAKKFEAESGHKVVPILGSTGKHYAQIINGAPFDLFLAADSKRPKLLDQRGAAVNNSRFTYAIGKLVLWSPKPGYVDQQGKVLEKSDFRYLAIANPKLAPYGKAAKELLLATEAWSNLRGRMVRGENIGQTFQFVKSGNADLGFVAYAQIKRPGHETEGSHWLVPQSLYSPVEQQMILLKDKPAARLFHAYMKSDAVKKIIQELGYDTP